VKFVGIDLAWKCVDIVPLSTAVCIIDEDNNAEIHLVTHDGEIISLIAPKGDCLVSIDTSLKVPNLTGMRSTEKLVRYRGISILPTSKNYLMNKFGGSGEKDWSKSWDKMDYGWQRQMTGMSG
jgi:predicted nuclease with RNAse H fold